MMDKWYNGLIKEENDGLVSLLNLFDDEAQFYNYFIDNSLFLDKTIINKQSEIFNAKINNKDSLPVRFTMKTKDHFEYANNNDKIVKKNSTKSFKNRKDAKIFAEKTDLIHKKTTIKVSIDGNGNYYVKKAIEENPSINFKNRTICHVWGKTHHPLFFSSLWNVVLIPSYLAFLTDKPKTDGKIIETIQLILKAICYKIYEPNSLYNNFELFDETEKKEIEEGIKLLEKFKINLP